MKRVGDVMSVGVWPSRRSRPQQDLARHWNALLALAIVLASPLTAAAQSISTLDNSVSAGDKATSDVARSSDSTMSGNAVAAHPSFLFTRIADDTGPIAEIGVAPVAINDAGQVAFLANLSTGKPAVFVGSGSTLTTVADTSSVFQSIGFADLFNRARPTHGFPTINGLGQAIFGALRTNNVSGVFVGAGAISIADSTTGPITFEGDPYSSGSGSLTVVQADIVIANRLRQAILVGNGGSLIRIADTSTTFAVLDADPRINRDGQVAFHGILRDGREGIFIGNGGALTTIADTSGPYASFSDAPAISDNGQVLFQATLKATTDTPEISGLFLSSAGQIKTVANDTGHFASFGFAPAINTQGQIAFLGTTKSGQVGVFAGTDEKLDRVVAIGDALDGSTVVDLSVLSFRTGLNNSGQIAFIAGLADGRTGVYRGDLK